MRARNPQIFKPNSPNLGKGSTTKPKKKGSSGFWEKYKRPAIAIGIAAALGLATFGAFSGYGYIKAGRESEAKIAATQNYNQEKTETKRLSGENKTLADEKLQLSDEKSALETTLVDVGNTISVMQEDISITPEGHMAFLGRDSAYANRNGNVGIYQANLAKITDLESSHLTIKQMRDSSDKDGILTMMTDPEFRDNYLQEETELTTLRTYRNLTVGACNNLGYNDCVNLSNKQFDKVFDIAENGVLIKTVTAPAPAAPRYAAPAPGYQAPTPSYQQPANNNTQPAKPKKDCGTLAAQLQQQSVPVDKVKEAVAACRNQ